MRRISFLSALGFAAALLSLASAGCGKADEASTNAPATASGPAAAPPPSPTYLGTPGHRPPK